MRHDVYFRIVARAGDDDTLYTTDEESQDVPVTIGSLIQDGYKSIFIVAIKDWEVNRESSR